MDSIEAATVWREANAPARKPRAKSISAPETSPVDLVPEKERRHIVDEIDDQGERVGDKASNPYDGLRRAKQAEEVAWEQIKKYQKCRNLI